MRQQQRSLHDRAVRADGRARRVAGSEGSTRLICIRLATGSNCALMSISLRRFFSASCTAALLGPDTRRRSRRPSGLRPMVISPRHLPRAPAVPRTVLAWAVMLKVNGVVAFAAPFLHASGIVPLGGYPGDNCQRLRATRGDQQLVYPQLEPPIEWLGSWSAGSMTSLTRKRPLVQS
jgi:hypothetical protein